MLEAAGDTRRTMEKGWAYAALSNTNKTASTPSSQAQTGAALIVANLVIGTGRFDLQAPMIAATNPTIKTHFASGFVQKGLSSIKNILCESMNEEITTPPLQAAVTRASQAITVLATEHGHLQNVDAPSCNTATIYSLSMLMAGSDPTPCMVPTSDQPAADPAAVLTFGRCIRAGHLNTFFSGGYLQPPNTAVINASMALCGAITKGFLRKPERPDCKSKISEYGTLLHRFSVSEQVKFSVLSSIETPMHVAFGVTHSMDRRDGPAEFSIPRLPDHIVMIRPEAGNSLEERAGGATEPKRPRQMGRPSDSPPPARRDNKRTKTENCRNFLNNKCSRTAIGCRYLHDGELKDALRRKRARKD